MKSFVVLIFLVALTLASFVRDDRNSQDTIEPQSNIQWEPVKPKTYYHKSVGIPLARLIRQYEDAMFSEDELNERIIGGSLNPVGVSPFLGGIVITLEYGGDTLCASSLLSNTRSLTAAHCWYDGDEYAEEFELVHGSATLYYGGVRTKTKNVTMHEDFEWEVLTNDIAMIYHSSIEYTDLISPIELPAGELVNNTFAGMWSQSVGYGRNASQSDPSGNIIRDQPQRIMDAVVMTKEECSGRWVQDSMICTSEKGRDGVKVATCQGDSGGPVFVVINSTTYLIGITSFGNPICESGESVCTRVTSFIDWITERL